jgi:Tol biopolymer transport system component
MSLLLIASVFQIAVAQASTGDVALMSTADGGTPKGNSDSGIRSSISGDGTRLAFESRATNLDAGDTDEQTDVYVKDAATGDLILASSSSAGVGDSSFFAGHPSIASNGLKVAFHSQATNLDPSDTDGGSTDVFIKDLSTLETSVVATSNWGGFCGGFGGNQQASLSANAEKVAFDSWDPLDFSENNSSTESDCDADVFVKNLTTGTLTRASQSESGVAGNGHSTKASLSADGTKVAFESSSSNLGPTDGNAVNDIYVKDLVTGAVTLVSRNDDGVISNGSSSSPSISADGNLIAFASRASNLDGTGTVAAADDDVYVKNLITGDVTLASSSDSGEAANGGTDAQPSLSSQGSKVSFWSRATNLDPETDGEPGADVYIKDIATGDIILASANEAGENANGVSDMKTALSANGDIVGFGSTATNLHPADGADALYDAYVLNTAPPPDTDGDGIEDASDDCPNVPEDADGEADDDGCPESPTSVSLTLRRHLRASGTVTSDPFTPCEQSATVKIQKRRSNGSWATVKTVTASTTGAYGGKVSDRAGKYRALVPARNSLSGWICGGSQSAARTHRH